MKRIETQGITYIERLLGSDEWYWGSDYASGDLYEAEELFLDGHPVTQNKLLFVHYPDGRVIQPVIAEKGQYFGLPIFYQGRIAILMADFPAGRIKIMQYDDTLDQTVLLAEVPRSAVKDCYNLHLETAPLMLTRQGHDNLFQILWPEPADLQMGEREAFLFREGRKLYFTTWQNEPEYWEHILVRNMDTGEVIERIPGTAMFMPDGQIWNLT